MTQHLRAGTWTCTTTTARSRLARRPTGNLARVDDRRASKLLALVLRHRPDAIGIRLDDSGWVSVEELLAAMTSNGRTMSPEQLQRVVDTNDKQRFAFDGTGERIRANQGHTVEVDLRLPARVPPERLFHGTVARAVPAIMRSGLRPSGRHAVHLSADVATAHKVGGRRGRPVVLVVDASGMH